MKKIACDLVYDFVYTVADSAANVSEEFKQTILYSYIKLNKNNHPKSYKILRKMLLENSNMPLISENNIHELFGGFKMIYDREFKEFFLESIEEILNSNFQDEDDGYYYDEDDIIDICQIQNRFAEIKAINANRKLTLDLAKSCIKMIEYDNILEGSEIVAEVASIAGYDEENYHHIQEIYSYGRQRVVSSIPRITGKYDGYTYEILKLTDPLAMIIGTLTDCCQEIGDVAETCMEHSMTSNDGRVFVIRDKNGNVASQSWVWRNKNILCFDNIEVPDKAFKRASKIYKNNYEFARDIFKIYQKAGNELILKDKEVRKKLYSDGLINSEQLEKTCINRITVGIGYNDIADIIKELASRENKIERPIPYNPAVELNRSLYTSDSNTQYLLNEAGNITDTKINDYLHYDFPEIKDIKTFTYIDFITFNTLRDLDISDTQIEDINYLEIICKDYNINPLITKIIINPNFFIIYEEYKEEIKLIDLVYLTEIEKFIGEDNTEYIDIEESVLMQLNIAIKSLNKRINISNLNSDQIEFYNKSVNQTKEINKLKKLSYSI